MIVERSIHKIKNDTNLFLTNETMIVENKYSSIVINLCKIFIS